MTRTLKIFLTFLLVAGGGWMLRPWAAQQIGSLARTSYFEQGRAHGPRMIEELGPLPSELRESSGLAVSRTQPGVLWSHNDSGDTPTLYAIDLKGRLLARVAVTDAIARDWEDIAMGTCPWEEPSGRQCLYVADTGNNDRSRNVLTVFVVLEPTVAGADPASPLPVQARAFRFRYPGESEDAEAIAVLPNGDVTIVTKGRTQKISFFGVSRADVAKAVTSGEVLTAANQGDTGIAPDQGLGRWATAAAMSPDGITLAVRTYSEIFFFAAENGPSTGLGASPQGHRWRDLKRPCFLGDTEPQGEAIDFLDEKTLVLGSETSQGRQGMLHRVRC